MRSPHNKLAVAAVLASYVLAVVGSPLLHRHRVSAYCFAHADCVWGHHSTVDPDGLPARSPAVAHAPEKASWASGGCTPSACADGNCPVCQFLAQKWLSTENATVPFFSRISRTTGPGGIAHEPRPVPVSWRIRAPPPAV
jgi:hypothetical protein